MNNKIITINKKIQEIRKEKEIISKMLDYSCIDMNIQFDKDDLKANEDKIKILSNVIKEHTEDEEEFEQLPKSIKENLEIKKQELNIRKELSKILNVSISQYKEQNKEFRKTLKKNG